MKIWNVIIILWYNAYAPLEKYNINMRLVAKKWSYLYQFLFLEIFY